jgi:hypothetical protein
MDLARTLVSAIVAGLVLGALAATVPGFVGGLSRGVLRWFGLLGLANVRTSAGAVFGITAATGINLSTSDHSHRMLSYIVWYGVAALALVVVIVTTTMINGRTARRRYTPAMADDDRRQQVNVGTNYGIAAGSIGSVNISAPQPNLQTEVIENGIEDGESVVKVRLTLSDGYAAKGLRVEASGNSPVKLDLSPDGGGMMMNVFELEDGPTRKAIEMASPPMNNAYVMTVHTAQPDTLQLAARLL